MGGRSSAGGNKVKANARATESKRQDVPILNSLNGSTLGYNNISSNTASDLYKSKEATEISIGRVNPKTGRWQTEAKINKYRGKWVGTANADLSTKEKFIAYMKGKNIKTKMLV